MGPYTEKYNKCIGALHKKTDSDAESELVNLDTMTAKQRKDYTRDGRIKSMIGKRMNEIDFKDADYGDLVNSKVIATDSWTVKGFELLTGYVIPLKLPRFLYFKYFKKAA